MGQTFPTSNLQAERQAILRNEVAVRACALEEAGGGALHRARLARRFLRGGRMPIKEIACELGLAKLAGFYRAFARETGISTDQYRTAACH